MLKELNKKPTQLVRVIAVIAFALAIFALLFIRKSTVDLSNQFDDTAYSNMTTYAEQCAAGIAKMKNVYSGLGSTLEVDSSLSMGREHVITNMASIMSHYEVYYLAYIAADGTGFNYRNEDITLKDLPFDASTIKDFGKTSDSEAYIGNTGRYEFCRQVPVMNGTTVIGDYYIGLSVNAQFNYLKNTNYKVFIVEKDTGRIIGSEGSTAMIGYTTANLYRLIDNYTSEDSRPSDADQHDSLADDVMSKGTTAILPMYHTDKDEIMCLTPVTDSNWYVCVTAEKQNIDGGKNDIVWIVYQLLLVCAGLFVVIGALVFFFQKRSAAKQQENIQIQKDLNTQLEAALTVAKNASQAKSDFLANMSHDIRTPMNAIVGMTNLALQNIDDHATATEDLKIVQSSSKHLLSLINDVLDLSKIESGKMVFVHEPFIITSVVNEITGIMLPLINAKSQAFTIHAININHEFVIGDQTRLKQVLVNLLNNANKYTPAGGKIDFTVEELSADLGTNTRYRFIVADTGIGISKERLYDIWSPFIRGTDTTVNAIEGTGLGLAIVKTVVEQQNGTISVTSEKDKGSEFTVEMPFGLQDEAKALSRYDYLHDKRILLLENTKGSCEDIQKLLNGIVEAVDVQSDLLSVIGILNTHQKYFAAIIDQQNRSYTSVSKIRENAPDLPILLLYSGNISEMEEGASAAGVDAFLQRPLFRSTLCEKLMSACNDAEQVKKQETYLKGKTVLIVDDQPINRMIARLMLEQADAVCEESDNGKHAVEQFEKSGIGYYDLILMDVMMPVMGGYEATRLIRSADRIDAKTIPIIAMTANAFADDIQKSLEAGMNAHISKPIESQSMKDTILRFLSRNKDV